MSSSMEIETTKRGPNLEKRCWCSSNSNTVRSKKAVFKSKLQQQRRSPNLSCSPDTLQCSAHILSSKSSNDLHLFFPGKLRQFPRTFMSKFGSNYDVRNDDLFRQEDKDFHQVKSWPPTQPLVIKILLLLLLSLSLYIYFCNA